MENTTIERINDRILKQRAFFKSGRTKDVCFRKEMLRAFEKGLRKWEKPICEALWQDLHKCYEEAYMTEIGLVYGEIKDARKHVGKWARRKRKASSYSPSSMRL